MSNKVALITGITGQDGSYLAELLLEKGYTVYGVIRRASSFNTQRIEHILQDVHKTDKSLLLVYGDLVDSGNISKIINNIVPDEIYNLGAQSHVKVSFDIPEYTSETSGMGALRILEVIREIKQKRGKILNITKHLLQKYLVTLLKFLKKRQLPFILVAHMGAQKRLLIG